MSELGTDAVGAGPSAAPPDPDDVEVETPYPFQPPAPEAAAHEWAWVAEWREQAEPAPWTLGVTLALFVGLLIGCAVYVLSDGLSDQPWIDVVVNVIVALGLAPAVWFARELPVIRWIAGGAVLGIVSAWLGALIFLV